MREGLAVYAGTFDPPTLGHLWMIEQGAKVFKRLIVAIGINPEKHCWFSLQDRVEMLQQLTAKLPNVEVHSFVYQYLVDYARSIGAPFIIRGIRNENDYEYERAMRNVNGNLNPDITTIFLMPPREISEVSSSLIKCLIGPVGWEEVVRKYLPELVFQKLKETHNARAR